MSYSSRVYRQRNPITQDESKGKPFFSKKKQVHKNRNDNSFFQAKEDSNIQRLATTPEEEKVSSNDQRMEKDKEKPLQRKTADKEMDKDMTVQKKDDPLKEKDKNVQKKGEEEKKEKNIQKQDDRKKEEVKSKEQ